MLSLYRTTIPTPSDYFGTLWSLAGIRDLIMVEHGPTGTAHYNLLNFGALGGASPRGKLFTTGLTEDDVVMGREDSLIKAVLEVDKLYKPRSIALVATAVTAVIGLDLDAVAYSLAEDTQAKLLSFQGGGFRGSYLAGTKEVVEKVSSEFAYAQSFATKSGINVLGPGVDDFNLASDLTEIRRLVGRFGQGINTVFTSDTSVEQVEAFGKARLNLVTKEVARGVAGKLAAHHGQDNVLGLPIGTAATRRWLEELGAKLEHPAVARIVAEEASIYSLQTADAATWRRTWRNLPVVISCPPDLAYGFTEFVVNDLGFTVELVNLTVEPEGEEIIDLIKQLGAKSVVCKLTEDQLAEQLKIISPRVMFGSTSDLLLAPKAKAKVRICLPSYDVFYRFDGQPHVGFRGALYLTQMILNDLRRQA